MAKNNNNLGQSSRSTRKGKRGPEPSMKFSKVNPLVNIASQVTFARNRGPVSRSTKNGVIISNQEKFMGVAGPASAGTVSVSTISVNPASTLFAWGSRILPNYALYRFRKLRFCYTSACPTTTTGDMVMGGFYDVNDALSWAALSSPQSNLTMNENSVNGPVWGSTLSHDSKGLTSNIMIEVDVQRLHARLPWFRTAPAVSQADSTAYNQAVPLTLGLTCLYAGTASLVVGYIWVDYEIEALHAQFPITTNTLLAEQNFLGTHDDQPLVESTSHRFPSVFAMRANCDLMEIDSEEPSCPPNSPC
jgi:hypothetical protein